MQAVARSRSPLRGRSRSGSPRRQWNEEMSMSHPPGGARGRVGGPIPWKTEHLPDDIGIRSGGPVGGMYSAQPPHRTILREELPAPPMVAGRSPLLGPDGAPLGSDSSWEKMMTFRTFVIDRVSEETESENAVVSYKQYKEGFRRAYTGRLFRQLKDLPVLAEKYDPQFVSKQFEESKQRCRLAASEFMKLLAEERFQNVALIEPVQDARPVAAAFKSFRLLIGPKIAQDPSFSPLTDPFYVPEDPDYFCLCLRNLPSQISKWDVHEHLTSVGAMEGLVDLTLTVPDGSQLTTTSANELIRTAWVKYMNDDACAAAEIKLEGTNFKRYTCRPVRRVPDVASYAFRVTPSETCHPARVSRDLRLSARLIVKLDDTFGVSELLGVSVNETEKEILTEARCQQHPVLAELPNVLQGVAGRTPWEQLDLQILYLRVVHCTCYYSGRRFSTPREIWDAVGPLYVRPKVLPEEVLSLQGFSKTGEIGNWDSDYTTAADIFQRLQQAPPEIVEANAYDDHEYFLKDESAGNCFEPSKAAPVVMPKDESMMDASLVKVEDVSGDVTTDSTMEDTTAAGSSSAAAIQIPDDDENKPIVIKSESDASSSRGRQSPWLSILDARITRLLRETFEIPLIDEENEEVAQQWTEFCSKNMSEVEAEKWRCSLCKKLFRGSDFVHKHLRNKHGNSLTPIVDQVKLKYMVAGHQNDPYRLPIPLPKPTPYLYRTAYLRQQRRQESPSMGPVGTMGGPPPLALPVGSVFAPFMPNIGGARLGTGSREYRDLDAPKPIVTANGNLRAAIQYDDL